MVEHTKLPWHVEGMTLCVVSDHAPKGRMRVADIRGWGYLTGKGDGALGLSDDEAFAIQEANADLIAKAVNNHHEMVEALKQSRDRLLWIQDVRDGKTSGLPQVGSCIEHIDSILSRVGTVKVSGGDHE